MQNVSNWTYSSSPTILSPPPFSRFFSFNKCRLLTRNLRLFWHLQKACYLWSVTNPETSLEFALPQHLCCLSLLGGHRYKQSFQLHSLPLLAHYQTGFLLIPKTHRCRSYLRNICICCSFFFKFFTKLFFSCLFYLNKFFLIPIFPITQPAVYTLHYPLSQSVFVQLVSHLSFVFLTGI